MRSSRTVVLLCLLLGGCTSLRNLMPSRSTPAEQLAASVTIVRDEWGVPYILGETDASTAFGLAYAQAEDDYHQIEEDYLHALGRASHWYGERYLGADLVKAAFEVERRAREEYGREPVDRRAVWDAFAAGLNYYIRTSGVQPRLITNYEPWMAFALLRSPEAGVTIDGVGLGESASRSAAGGVQLAGAWNDSAAGAADRSSMWAVAPSRSASGHALLLQRIDGEFFGTGRPYEAVVLSDEGWHVRGFAVLGTPVPASGHNAQLAWSRTTATADYADVYEVTFDHPTDPLMYRFDGEWRRAVEWHDTLRVNSPDGVVERVFMFRRTHHGPVVVERDAHALAMRVARMEEGGALQQLYAMGRARDLNEFRAALDQRALTSSTMYADVDGNIFYVHGNGVPVRDTTFDWTHPVDGSTSATEWRGYHAIDDLPQIANPGSGWIQDAGSTPFLASAAADNPDPAHFPRYMTSAADNGRARASRRLLSADSSWTLDEWTAAAFDTWVADAGSAIPSLVAEWEQTGGYEPTRARRLDAAVELLRSWDHVAAVESQAATLFVLWQDRLRSGAYTGELARFRAMEAVITRLERDWDSIAVSLGELNRLQRIDANGSDRFGDDRPSLPIGGTAGSLFAISARDETGARRRYAVSGTGWIAALELAPNVPSHSVVPFGQSADSTSPHWFDQAALLAGSDLKRGWFTREEIMANARDVYRPSDAAAR